MKLATYFLQTLCIVLCLSVPARAQVAGSWPTGPSGGYPLTDGATISPLCPGSADANGVGISGFYALTVLGNNHTISLPSCPTPAAVLFRITQGAGGPYTGLSFSGGSNTLNFTNSSAYVQTPTAGAADDVGGQIVSSTVWDLWTAQANMGPPPTWVSGGAVGTLVSAATSATVTIANATAGMAILCAIPYNGTSTITGVADNASNTFAQIGSNVTTGTNPSLAVWAKFAIAGTPTVVTVSSSANMLMQIGCDIYKNVSGVDGGTAFSGNHQTSPGLGADAVTSGLFTTIKNGDIIWAAQAVVPATDLPVVGTGFIKRQQDTSLVNFYLTTEDKTQGTANASTAGTFTMGVQSGSTNNNATFAMGIH